VGGPGPGSLPFAVDAWFLSTGYMGDYTWIQMDNSCVNSGRSGPAAAGAKCWHILFTPPAAGAVGWAGVDWQYPANNWDQATAPMAGVVIPPGATRITFYAWGKAGDAVSFNAGYGVVSDDGFGVSLGPITLTATPTLYSIDLTGVSYTCPSVRMGFGWALAGPAPTEFFIDDIEWRY